MSCQPSKDWAVVTFLNEGDSDEESTSEIPTTWLIDETTCYWPMIKNVSLCISKRQPPQTGKFSWTVQDIKVEAYCDTLEVARKRAESYSSGDERRDKGRGFRKKKKSLKIINEDYEVESLNSSPDDSIDLTQLPQYPSEDNVQIQRTPQISQSILKGIPKIVGTIDSDLTQLPQYPPEESVQIKRPPQISQSILKGAPKIVDLIDSDVTQLPPCPQENKKTPQISKSILKGLPKITGTIDSDLTQLPPYPQQHVQITPQISQSILKGPPKTITTTIDSDFTNIPIIIDDTNNTASAISESLDSIKEFLESEFSSIHRKLQEISLNLVDLNKRLEKIEFSKHEYDATQITDLLNLLPLKTKEDVSTLEILLEDENVKRNMETYIKNIGGSSLKDIIYRALKRCFSNEFAITCSWLGQRNNFKIYGLKIIDIIRTSTSKKHSEKEFETIVAEWFRQARLRHTREMSKIDNTN